jgi:hypothetical protein
MKHLKHLKYMLATCMYMQYLDLLLQHPNKTLATYIWNIWNTQLKHTCIAINICNIPIYFATSIYNICNIPLKHLKYTVAICAFSIASTCYLNEWRLAGAELDAAEWRAGGGGCQRAGNCVAPASGCAATDELLCGSRR